MERGRLLVGPMGSTLEAYRDGRSGSVEVTAVVGFCHGRILAATMVATDSTWRNFGKPGASDDGTPKTFCLVYGEHSRGVPTPERKEERCTMARLSLSSWEEEGRVCV